MVDDQEKAREVYIGKLGFVLKRDTPAGEFSLLAVAPPDGDGEVELLLEPANFPPARVYQRELRKAMIAAAAFAVDDVHAETERLRGLGFEIVSEPGWMGRAVAAEFDDTCGNIIRIYELLPTRDAEN